MRDPLGLNERAFARVYPIICGFSERAGGREIRARVFSEASGRTLEVGAGSGLNVPHYTERVAELVVSDPSPHMRAQLEPLLESEPPPVGSVELVECGAEEIPFEDSSFDTVTAGYVFCTVPDPRRGLAEVARVLRPGGRFLFLEHVHAGDGTMRGRIQNLVEVPHRYFAAGCHPNRDTERTIRSSPLEIEWVEHGEMPRALPTVRPIIFGAARLPD